MTAHARVTKRRGRRWGSDARHAADRAIRTPLTVMAMVLSASICAGAPGVPIALVDPAPASDAAIARAISWLRGDLREEWRADATAILVFLDRKFFFPGLTELALTAMESFDRSVAKSQGFTTPYFRLIDPDSRPEPSTVEGTPGLTGRVVAKALHCDWLGLDPGFWSAIERMADHGGYGLTHAVLAGRWIEENGCARHPDLDDLEARWIDGLSRLIDTSHIPTDLRAESMAMLFYAGHRDRVRAGQVTSLLEAQLPDGSWPLDGARNEGHAHATSLALWTLLESRYGNTQPVPMIRRRTDCAEPRSEPP